MKFAKKNKHPWRIGVLGMIVFALLILLCLPSRTPLVQIEASTRSVEFKSINGAFSVINFPEPVLLTVSEDSLPECVIGTLMPPPNSMVHYDIYRDSLIIKSDKPMSFVKKTDRQ